MPKSTLFLILGLLLAGGVSAGGVPEGPRPALQLVEQASQEGFPLERPFLDQGSHKLQAAGVYLRVREGEKRYALCLYVDLKRLSRLTRNTERTPEALAQWLVQGKVAHAFVSRFVQTLPQANRMDFLLQNLKAFWPGQGFDPTKPRVRAFLGFFDRPAAQGTETQVWLDGKGGIEAREVGGPHVKVRDRDLCRAFSSSYLGTPAMDAAMKEDLLKDLPAVMDMIEMLGRPVETAPAR